MFGLGAGELAIILGILVVLFGASKLPALGHGIGKGVANFKSALSLDDDKKAIDNKGEQA